MDPRSNNFNLLRLIAASSVIFSHAFDITAEHHDPFERWIGYPGGWIAVSAFFSISGMLIYRSMVRSRNVREYVLARALRILPGLWVMLLVTVVLFGILFSSQTPLSFFSSEGTFEYFAGNAVLYMPRYSLPGVFGTNPLPDAVNGSLWTLRFEFTCYLAVLLLFLLRAYRSERAFALTIALYATGYVGFLVLSAMRGELYLSLFDGSDMAKIHRLSFAFVLGMLIGRYLDKVRFHWWMVPLTGLAAWLAFGTAAFPTILMLLIATIVFWLAFLQHSLLVPLRRMHDYSYGIYIYAFPVQQAIAHVNPALSPIINALVGLAIVVPLAAASWYWIESPALRLKAHLVANRATA